MALEIGALRAMLSLDSAAFEKGAKRAQASMNNLQRSLKKTGDRMQRIGRTMTTRMTAPIVAATGVLVRSSLQAIDAQAKMAESMGTTTASLQVLARAADTAGISQGDLDGSLRRMTRRISLAAQGTGAGAKAFERLGIAFEDMESLDAAERVALIQERISELVPVAEQAGVASQIFGDKTGLAMLRLNPDNIASAADELERFGVTVTEVEADKIEETNDAISAIGLVTRGLGNQLAVALAPTLQSIAEKIADLGAWFNKLSPQMQRFAGVAAAVAAAAGPAAIAIGFVASGLAAVASPIGVVIVGLAAAAAGAAYVAANFDRLRERFPILDSAANFGGRLKEAWADLPAIKWAALIPVLRWSRFVPGLRWTAIIPSFTWFAFIPRVIWRNFLPTIRWAALAGALRWPSLITPLVWGARFIPVIGWTTLAGSLAWSALVNRIEWSGWIPTIVWRDWVPSLNWSEFIPEIDWQELTTGGATASGPLLRGEMRNLGRGGGAGLSEGFEDRQDDVRAAGEALSEAGLEGAADAMDIRSPSREMMKLGRFAGEGLMIGAEDMLSDVMGAGERLGESLGSGVQSGLDRTLDTVISGLQRGDLSNLGRDLLGVAQDSFFGNVRGWLGGLGQKPMQGPTLSGAPLGGGGLLGGLGGMFGGGIGGAIGAALPIIGGITTLISAFRPQRENRAAGSDISVIGDDVELRDVQSYVNKRFFGLFTSSLKRDYSDVDPATEAAAAQAIQSVVSSAATLGFDRGLDGFTFEAEALDGQGSLEQVIGQAVEAAAQHAADGAVDAFRRKGEELSETITRMANAMTTVVPVLGRINDTARLAGLSGADMASQVADLFGGVQGFMAAADGFYRAFYSEAERVESLTRSTTDAMRDLGFAMPDTRAQFRALVEAQDLTTESGRETFAALVGLSGALDTILPPLEDAAAAIEGLMGGVNSAVGVMIEESRNVAREADTAARNWFRASDNLRDLIRDLTTGRDSALPIQNQQAVLADELRRTFMAAQGGSLSAFQDFPGVAQDFLSVVSDTAGSANELRMAQARVRVQANTLAGIADFEGGRAQVMQTLAEDQVTELQELNDYLQSVETVDPAVLAAFEGELGSLSDAIAQIERLSFANLASELSGAIDFAITANLPFDVQRLVMASADGLGVALDLAIDQANLSTMDRFLAVAALGGQVSTLNLAVRDDDLTNRQRKIVLGKIPVASQVISLSITSPTLTDDERRGIFSGVNNLTATINAELNRDGSDWRAIRLGVRDRNDFAVDVTAQLIRSKSEQNALRLGLRGGSKYRVQITGTTDDATSEMMRLIEAAGGNGTFRLNGSVAFDPSSAFAETLQDGMANPMDRLRDATLDTRDALHALRDMIASQEKARRDEIKRQEKIASLQARADRVMANWGGNSINRAQSVANAINAAGVQFTNDAGQILGGAFVGGKGFVRMPDGTTSIAGGDWDTYNEFFGAGGLRNKMEASNQNRRNYFDRLDMLRDKLVDLDAIPGFASGGMHAGGLRIVGERGPELEATGPARYYDANRTAAMMGGSDPGMVQELRALRREVEHLRQESKERLSSINNHADYLQRAERRKQLQPQQVEVVS